MKLIKQSKLFFKEGNSDKVYEIDLCELGAAEYLVNFRYGKRGAALKEGTKTPTALKREQAEVLFAELENEKRKKGYQTETEMFIELPSLEAVEPASINGAILQRLQDAVTGNSSFKTQWKTSRVIWKAGALQISEAIPFIIKLATRGDEMQAYASLWALTQLKAQQGIPVFNAYAFNIKQKQHLRNVAFEGLCSIAQGSDKEQVFAVLQEQLPAEVKFAIDTDDKDALKALLTKHTSEDNVAYFTTLYLLVYQHLWLLTSLYEVLGTWQLRPPYFKQIRAIYKIAQLRKDPNIISLFAYRFEKEEAMFKRTSSLDATHKSYIPAIGQLLRVGSELKSKESKLAFSQFTKAYFQKNSVTYLEELGLNAPATAYLKLAVAILLTYREKDYSPAGERPISPYGQYNYQTRMYSFTLYNYAACSKSLLLSAILFGGDTNRQLTNNLEWIRGKRTVVGSNYYYSEDNVSELQSPAGTTQQTPSQQINGSVLDAAVSVFKNLFGKKSKEQEIPKVAQPTTAIEQPVPNEATPARPELYPQHWDAFPEAYVQLLMQAKMNIVHQFAYNNLRAHPNFETISQRFDGHALLQLLNSDYEMPTQLGFELLEQRTVEFYNQPKFVAQVLDCNNKQARQWARTQIDKDSFIYLNELEFTMLLLFNNRAENESWITTRLQQHVFDDDKLQAITGKTVAELLSFSDDAHNNERAKLAIIRLDMIAGQHMQRISWSIVEQLISSPLEANKILAGNILLAKSAFVSPTEIPVSLTERFLQNELLEVRANGIKLLQQYPETFLVSNLSFLLDLANTLYVDVLQAMFTAIQRLLPTSPASGNTVIQHLVYALIRKEKFETAHSLLGNFIIQELKPYHHTGLQPRDITKLVHAHYRNSQLTGYELLKRYDKPQDFSIGQVVSFASHELLAVRQWCWLYFKQNAARIRYEKDKSLALLDAKWDDSRAFAFHFFRTEFTAAEWDAETLISIVDAIRPDVEQFGKQLITQYFKPEFAEEFLTKLSQHPGINVQTFVTHYLELYAAGKPELLEQLSSYFRTVLMKVNKARVAKARIFYFLHQQALQSERVARIVVPVIDDVSAQCTVQDKATCIMILTEIKNQYPTVEMHLTLKNELYAI